MDSMLKYQELIENMQLNTMERNDINTIHEEIMNYLEKRLENDEC